MKQSKRILALIGIVILVGLYVVTFIASIMNTEFSQNLFTASLYCTVIVPIMMYAYTVVYKAFKKTDKNDQDQPNAKK